MHFTIRPERESDFPAIYSLVHEAFTSTDIGEGDEADFVVQMRSLPSYIPDLTLVAETESGIAGFVMLTETEMLDAPKPCKVLMLAPLCVAPSLWGKGAGGALMRDVLSRAADSGWSAVFLAGDPGYYSRFGYRSVADFGIRHQLPVADKYIQAKELVPGVLREAKGAAIVLPGHTTCASAIGKPSQA